MAYATVPDWPMYCVGSDGTVWSRWRGPWERVAPFPCTSGHLGVNLVAAHDPAVRRRAYVHVLVLTAFAGPPRAGARPRFLDGDRTNTARANLAWATKKGTR